jgi:dTDP-4-amino-4,6-dideoxygalactose transaminase
VIKLLTPKMPTIDAALPYIRRSEEARWYSNFGPNVLDLERRLSEKYMGAYVVTCANATAGLEMVYTLKMIEGYRKIPLPALTFPATWLAANRSGLEILPIDVHPDTWVAPGVSGFGVPTYAPVVDAAGAFGEQSVPLLKEGMVAVFSMHATKSVGAGEGGYCVTWDEGEAAALRQFSNFGIDKGMSIFAGTNAKMSEYAAAMALASLDAWDREAWLNLFDLYDKHLPGCVVKQKRPRGAYSLLPVKLPVPAGPVLERMKEAGVECRRWYTPTLDRHPLFEHRGNREYRRANPLKLPVTKDLAEHLLGVPYHLFLTEQDVKQVCETLEQCVEATQPA